MNWVGGIKRRVLQKEEIQRRQENFFSQHNEKRSTGYWNKHSQTAQSTKDTKRADSHYKTSNSQEYSAPTVCDSDKIIPHDFSRLQKRLDVKSNIKLGSIHGPFSEYLLKMEMNATRKKIQNDLKHTSNINKINRVITNCNEGKHENFQKALTMHKFTDCTSDSGVAKLNTTRGSGSLRTFNKPKNIISKNKNKNYNKSSLLKGAPKFRALLTLSPKASGKQQIWVPLEVPNTPFVFNKMLDKLDFKRHQNASGNTNKVESITINHKTENHTSRDISINKQTVSTPFGLKKNKSQQLTNPCTSKEKNRFLDLKSDSFDKGKTPIFKRNLSNIPLSSVEKVRNQPDIQKKFPHLTRNLVSIPRERHDVLVGHVDKTHYATFPELFALKNILSVTPGGTSSESSSKTPSDGFIELDGNILKSDNSVSDEFLNVSSNCYELFKFDKNVETNRNQVIAKAETTTNKKLLKDDMEPKVSSLESSVSTNGEWSLVHLHQKKFIESKHSPDILHSHINGNLSENENLDEPPSILYESSISMLNKQINENGI